MYEETKRTIDWKGIFLKVIIAFLIILIAIKGYTLLKDKNSNKKEDTTAKETLTNKTSTTFTQNMEKLKEVGEKYFKENTSKIPTKKGKSTTITLNELIEKGYINFLKDEEGKDCDVNNSYVAAILEDNEPQLKANLVCGNTSDYTLVYIEKTETKKEQTTETNTNTTTNTNTENTTTNKETNNTCANNCTQNINVNTTISQTITIKKPETTTKPATKYYTIKFDKNGGVMNYDTQLVMENKKVAYPGLNQKVGCKFNGWYYNGKTYDFATPVKSDMTLVANYTCKNIEIEKEDKEPVVEKKLVTKTYSKYVYSVGWGSKNINTFTVNHTLKLPSILDDENVKNVRLKSVNYVGPINNMDLTNTYKNNFNGTFIYVPNGWEYTIKSSNNLSTINVNAVTFSFDSNYKTLVNSLANGFDVTWKASSIEKYCTEPFNVKTATNLCGYGIYYRATWEYQIYE